MKSNNSFNSWHIKSSIIFIDKTDDRISCVQLFQYTRFVYIIYVERILIGTIVMTHCSFILTIFHGQIIVLKKIVFLKKKTISFVIVELLIKLLIFVLFVLHDMLLSFLCLIIIDKLFIPGLYRLAIINHALLVHMNRCIGRLYCTIITPTVVYYTTLENINRNIQRRRCVMSFLIFQRSTNEVFD